MPFTLCRNLHNSSLNINSISETIHVNRSEILGDRLGLMVLSHQNQLLFEDLGVRYSRSNCASSFCCPRCYGCHFTRKGKRKRVYKSVLGKTSITIVQVQCKQCKHRFCPYKKRIGIGFKDRNSQGLLDRQLAMTCDVPYGKSARFTHMYLGINLSPMTIRKEIDRQASVIRSLPIKAKDKVVYQDSTKVKAGPKERGVSLHLAITADPLDFLGSRKRMKKQFLFMATGNADSIKKKLSFLQARAIVHDGDMDLTGCAPFVQRCLWHLPHQLHHFLWQDGLNVEARREHVKKLIEVLYGSESIQSMKKSYSKMTEDLKSNGLNHAAVHLARAEKEISVAKEHNFPYPTTSPVEREMREINRRSDVGVRWSTIGVENLLNVKTFRKLNSC